jgi:hypothetical protein
MLLDFVVVYRGFRRPQSKPIAFACGLASGGAVLSLPCSQAPSSPCLISRMAAAMAPLAQMANRSPILSAISVPEQNRLDLE